MNFYVLNEELEIIAVVDQYKSAIWTSRYSKAGDFEIYLPATPDNLSIFQKRYYVIRDDRPELIGIIEKIKISTSANGGDFLTISGRDGAAILWRRIIWLQTTFSGSVEDVIRRMIAGAFISPEDSDRQVDNLSLDTPIGGTDKIQIQFTGDNVGDSIAKLCQEHELGFKVLFDRSTALFTFSLYRGTDRSNDQDDVPRVVFSEEFDNLLKSDYTDDGSGYKNVARIAGEGQGLERVKTDVGTATGLDRYEVFVNASQTTNNKGELTKDAYISILKQKGNETLTASELKESMTGEVAPNYGYKLNQDYFLGDIVEIVNEYGKAMKSRVTEVIESWAPTGYTCLPKFDKS